MDEETVILDGDINAMFASVTGSFYQNNGSKTTLTFRTESRILVKVEFPGYRTRASIPELILSLANQFVTPDIAGTYFVLTVDGLDTEYRSEDVGFARNNALDIVPSDNAECYLVVDGAFTPNRVKLEELKHPMHLSGSYFLYHEQDEPPKAYRCPKNLSPAFVSSNSFRFYGLTLYSNATLAAEIRELANHASYTTMEATAVLEAPRVANRTFASLGADAPPIPPVVGETAAAQTDDSSVATSVPALTAEQQRAILVSCLMDDSIINADVDIGGTGSEYVVAFSAGFHTCRVTIHGYAGDVVFKVTGVSRSFPKEVLTSKLLNNCQKADGSFFSFSTLDLYRSVPSSLVPGTYMKEAYVFNGCTMSLDDLFAWQTEYRATFVNEITLFASSIIDNARIKVDPEVRLILAQQLSAGVGVVTRGQSPSDTKVTLDAAQFGALLSLLTPRR